MRPDQGRRLACQEPPRKDHRHARTCALCAPRRGASSIAVFWEIALRRAGARKNDLDEIFLLGNTHALWEVEYTDDFEAWWNTLPQGAQEALDATVQLLMEGGP